ncbi:GFA family protein [Sphingomonas parva]|uniref:GFA family protein n=1 Tax=Sphingomonas parva TaxID=2555898 RepID=A0A4Y8ZVL6_9SPHN|nr:GFA family protein [Sphingomonas parva]TFI59362.1 GFA family protein [Sphingomonas parva]
MADRMEGGCACGRVRYVAEVDNDDAYLCHCRMCQRATGSVSIAFKGIRKDAVTWAQAPDLYTSSPIARRPYCRECGTSLGFEFPDSETMDLTVASFDDPSRFVPRHHFGAESLHRAWLNTEGLKEIRTEEHKTLVERWVKATGSAPV